MQKSYRLDILSRLLAYLLPASLLICRCNFSNASNTGCSLGAVEDSGCPVLATSQLTATAVRSHIDLERLSAQLDSYLLCLLPPAMDALDHVAGRSMSVRFQFFLQALRQNVVRSYDCCCDSHDPRT